MGNDRSPIHPEWVTGFVDGEGCFFVGLSKNVKLKLGIEVRPSFSVSQGSASKQVMRELAACFNHGSEQLRVDRYTLKYESRSAEHLRNVICPHFDRYPLRSQKVADFLTLKRVLDMMSRGEHRTREGLKDVITMAYKMNLDPNSKSRRQHPIEYWLSMLDGDAP